MCECAGANEKNKQKKIKKFTASWRHLCDTICTAKNKTHMKYSFEITKPQKEKMKKAKRENRTGRKSKNMHMHAYAKKQILF